MDVAELSLDQLKVLAWDQLVQVQRAQRNLSMLETEIAKRAVAPSDVVEGE